MYKKVKKYALGKGLTVDDKAGIAYGNINGYFVVIHQDPATPARHTLQLWVKTGNVEPYPAIVDFVNGCPSKYKYLQTASYSGTKIIAEFWGVGFKWGSAYVPCMDEFLNEVTNYCRSNQLVTCCESCGNELGLSLYQVESVDHLLCSACYAEASDKIRQTVNEKAKEGNGNIIGGIIGALLGSLLGVIVWVLIYQLGYISAAGGAVMVICALKGYELLGGRLNIVGIVISCIISVIMLLFAEQVCLSIEIYQAFRDYDITFFDAFQSVPAFLEEPEIISAVGFDLVMGYILLAAGAWGTIHQTYKKNKNSVNTKMIANVTAADTNANNTYTNTF